MIHRMRWSAVFLVAALLAPAPFAGATHEVDHRVTVRGAIYESDGTPRSRSAVSLVGPGGEVLGTTDTNRAGKFQFVLHLHDEDAGRMLVVRSGATSREFRLTFDSGNRRAERIVTVVIGQQSPQVRRRAAILAGVGIAALAGLVAGAALLLTRKTRKRNKRKGKGKPGVTGSGAGHAGRSPKHQAAAADRRRAGSGGSTARGQRKSRPKRR